MGIKEKNARVLEKDQFSLRSSDRKKRAPVMHGWFPSVFIIYVGPLKWLRYTNFEPDNNLCSHELDSWSDQLERAGSHLFSEDWAELNSFAEVLTLHLFKEGKDVIREIHQKTAFGSSTTMAFWYLFCLTYPHLRFYLYSAKFTFDCALTPNELHCYNMSDDFR